MKVRGVLAVLILSLSVTPPAAYAAAKPHVLMISIDGMRPDDITAADEHHLKIPMLRSLLNGTYADGVVNSVPANTYPNHTTLVTGVWPAEHGIYNNLTFDPLMQHPDEWYWYAKDIRVPTLWQVAQKAGLKTASIGWPVTNGATGVNFLISELSQSEEAGELRTANDDVPAGLRKTLAPETVAVSKSKMDGDVKKVMWATALIKRENPNFFTVHINDLDHAQHATGLWSEASNKALETIDEQVGELVKTELAIDPDAYIVVVSDHGFANVDTRVNIGVLFVKAGLQPLAKKGETLPPDTPWQASAWNEGGMSAIMLHDPSDKKVLAQVEALLQDAAKNPAYGIARILTRDQIKPLGGFPDASFIVEFKPGFTSSKSLRGSVVVSTPGHGAHGYLSDRPEMHSSFFMMGKHVAAHRDLGIIDMRQIAPTVAQILGASMPSAKQKPVHYQP